MITLRSNNPASERLALARALVKAWAGFFYRLVGAQERNPTRHCLTVYFMVLLIVPATSFACKELVRFPAHLDVEDGRNHYLVQIERAKDDKFAGTVVRSFGGAFSSGQGVVVHFKTGEEPHAVCPIRLLPGQTYLLRSESTSGELEISRFNWLNVPANHERFEVYVQDLAATQNERPGT